MIALSFLLDRGPPFDPVMPRALHILKKHYAIVGFLEDMSAFFEVLEFFFPVPFKGATKIYNKMGRNATEYLNYW